MVAYSLLNDLILSALLGFDTYLALPVVMSKRFVASRAFYLFNAIAVGILIFLLLDIYTDVNEVLFPNSSMIADPGIATAFAVTVAIAFLVCYWTEGEEGEEAEISGNRTAFAVALGIGFQNLTEGLVFGAAWVLGQQALALVILVGYGVQNMTEGFPLVAAYLAKPQPSWGRMTYLFFVRGVPTVIGGAIGFLAVNSLVTSSGAPTYLSDIVGTVFNGLAIGSIVYCILPILRSSFLVGVKNGGRATLFIGILVGVLVGFGVGLF